MAWKYEVFLRLQFFYLVFLCLQFCSHSYDITPKKKKNYENGVLHVLTAHRKENKTHFRRWTFPKLNLPFLFLYFLAQFVTGVKMVKEKEEPKFHEFFYFIFLVQPFIYFNAIRMIIFTYTHLPIYIYS